MTTNAFSAADAVRQGWAVLKREPSVFLGLVVLQLATMSLQGSATHPSGGSLAGLVGQAAGVAIGIGWWRVALRALQGEPVSLAALTELTWTEALRYFVTIVLLVVGFVVGLVLLIAPGVYFVLRFAFAPIVVVDEGLEPLDAMRRSYELTEGALAEMLVLALTLFGLNLLGTLALGIGLLVTMPISIVAAGYAYRALRSRESLARRSAPPLDHPLAVTP